MTVEFMLLHSQARLVQVAKRSDRMPTVLRVSLSQSWLECLNRKAYLSSTLEELEVRKCSCSLLMKCFREIGPRCYLAKEVSTHFSRRLNTCGLDSHYSIVGTFARQERVPAKAVSILSRFVKRSRWNNTPFPGSTSGRSTHQIPGISCSLAVY